MTATRTTAIDTPPIPTGTARDFAFLQGRWTASHNKLLTPGGALWAEFGGTMTHHRLIDGLANIDEYRIEQTGGSYDAVAVRTFDKGSRQWSIWWFDTRYPQLGLGTPVRGAFSNGDFASGGRGFFYSSQTADGMTIHTRFIWQKSSDGRPQWEQATSTDGLAWTPNWRFVLTPA